MFQLGATSQTFRETITLVAGDNLGNQYIGACLSFEELVVNYTYILNKQFDVDNFQLHIK